MIPIDESHLRKVLDILEPVRVRHTLTGEADEAEAITKLKKHLASALADARSLPTASSMGAKGGKSRSKSKIAAARKNSQKAGPPGHYYGCLILGAEKQYAIYFEFHNKASRDKWVGFNNRGYKKAVKTINPSLKIVRRQDPESLADGDQVLQKELERDRLWQKNERYHNDQEDCEGCADLIDSRDIRNVENRLLCGNCVTAIRPYSEV